METIEEGAVIVPRRVGLWVMLGSIVFLCGQIYIYADTQASTRADIQALVRADADAKSRGDDVRRRVQDLEHQRSVLSDRLARIETKTDVHTDMLRQLLDASRSGAR